MVVKKIFDGIFDEELHLSFLKFGRGEYKNKFLLEGKRQSSKWAIKTSAEFANFLVKKCLEKVSGKIKVKGVIVSTHDLRDELDFPIEKVSNFQGVRKHILNTEVEPAQILESMQKHPRTFFALSFKTDEFDLKIKAKAPTSGKPGKESEDGPKADFCTLKTKDEEIVNELFFDEPSFKESRISHTLKIENIVYPENMDQLSPKEVREQSKRQGVIVRKIVTDGNEKTAEAKFTA